MGGTLGPLVQGPSVALGRKLRISATFSAAFAVGSLLTFACVGLVHTAVVRPWLDHGVQSWLVIVGLAALLVLDLVAVRRGDFCPLAMRRQTPARLLNRGELTAAVVWGLDLGTAISTFRVCASTWGALWLVLLGCASPWAGLIYAAGFVVPQMVLWWAPGAGKNRREWVDRLMWLTELRPVAQWTSAVLLAVGVGLGLARLLG